MKLKDVREISCLTTTEFYDNEYYYHPEHPKNLVLKYGFSILTVILFLIILWKIKKHKKAKAFLIIFVIILIVTLLLFFIAVSKSNGLELII